VLQRCDLEGFVWEQSKTQQEKILLQVFFRSFYWASLIFGCLWYSSSISDGHETAKKKTLFASIPIHSREIAKNSQRSQYLKK